MKLCINCKHCKIQHDKIDRYLRYECHAPFNKGRHPVDGTPGFNFSPYCQILRQTLTEPCGPSGKMFEPHTEQQEIYIPGRKKKDSCNSIPKKLWNYFYKSL